MTKNILVRASALLFAILFSFSSCKKDSDDTNSDNAILVGKWVVLRSALQINSGSVEWEEGDGSFFEFEASGKATHSYKPRPEGGFYENDKATYTFDVDRREIVFKTSSTGEFLDGVYKIKTITASAMTLETTSVEKGDTYFSQIFLKKQ